MASTQAAKSATNNAISITKKYTVPSTGIWERIRRFLVIDPNRSNGVPLNTQFRNPPPGSNPPTSYDEPTTIPASDIAENPYWRRDVRRAYPRISFVSQSDVVALLTVGSQAQPKPSLAAGEEGSKQLVEVRKEAEEKGLSELFRSDDGKKSVGGVLGPDGLPPFPVALGGAGTGRKLYGFSGEKAYPDGYPCRGFT